MNANQTIKAGNAKKLTDLELRLIDLLTIDSRQSVTTLSKKLNVSRTTVKDKIDSLIDCGIIKGFTIDLGDASYTKAKAVRTFFHIRMRTPSCKVLYSQVKHWPEVEGCWSISSNDLDMLLLISADDQSQIEMVRDKLATNNLVQTMFTTFVLKDWMTGIGPLEG